MSNYQRTRASPSEFAATVQEYYSQRADYDRDFEDQASKTHKPPSNEAESNDSLPAKQAKMSDHVKGDITDHVAKDSKDSTASTHANHNVEIPGRGSAPKPKASAADHNATPGPVMTDKLPEAASKEELKKRAEELNK